MQKSLQPSSRSGPKASSPAIAQSLPLSDGEIDCAQPNQPTSDGYLRTWAELPADMHRAAKTIFGEAIPALTFDKVVGHFHRLSH